jgi:hypothetical protein
MTRFKLPDGTYTDNLFNSAGNDGFVFNEQLNVPNPVKVLLGTDGNDVLVGTGAPG